jgi:FtsH-binding integral membrane protein
MIGRHHLIPVWFFVGVMILIYGIAILLTGLFEWTNPPATVLANVHAPVWWGALLVVLGAFYCYRFRPRSPRERQKP